MVEQKRITELPLNGRHVFNLVKVVAGVVPRSNTTDGFAEVSNQTFSQMRFNGGPAYGNQFFLDGVSNSAAVHNEISVVPMADAVEEFRVETNAIKAEFGQTAGGVVNAVTRSGGNDVNGSLYEFFRNDALDARNAFSTQPDPRTGRLKQILRYNQYGGTLGGPVWLPKIYNGRNRDILLHWSRAVAVALDRRTADRHGRDPRTARRGFQPHLRRTRRSHSHLRSGHNTRQSERQRLRPRSFSW